MIEMERGAGREMMKTEQGREVNDKEKFHPYFFLSFGA